MSAFAHLPYRPGVGMMVLNAKDEVFVGRRIDTRAEAWQMPQGGVDEGESLEIAARRELAEETGITAVTLLGQCQRPYRYDLPDTLVPQLWKGRFRGQEQSWFAYRYLGTDAEINIATEHAEFCAWKWAPMAQLPKLIVPFKRDLYAALVAEFSAMLRAA